MPIFPTALGLNRPTFLPDPELAAYSEVIYVFLVSYNLTVYKHVASNKGSVVISPFFAALLAGLKHVVLPLLTVIL